MIEITYSASIRGKTRRARAVAGQALTPGAQADYAHPIGSVLAGLSKTAELGGGTVAMPSSDRSGWGGEELQVQGDDRERQAGFAALLARHHVALMGFVLSLVPSWSDAEDIVQEASAVMWRKYAEFEPGTNFLAWACQIARFLVMNHIRKRARDAQLLTPEVAEAIGREAEDDLERLEAERVALQTCLEKLDHESRDLLSRCYAPGITIKEVAEGLRRTPNSIYKTLNRVREVLLRCIQRRLAAEGM